VSRGELPNADNPSAAFNGGNGIVFNWINNAGTGHARAADRVVLVAYCKELNECEYTTAGAPREAGTAILGVKEFKGYPVQTYIAFISENGVEISNSIYTGEISLV